MGGSKDGVLAVKKSEKQSEDLTSQLQSVMQHRMFNAHGTLQLRGGLSFADGFLHGRLGAWCSTGWWTMQTDSPTLYMMSLRPF